MRAGYYSPDELRTLALEALGDVAPAVAARRIGKSRQSVWRALYDRERQYPLVCLLLIAHYAGREVDTETTYYRVGPVAGPSSGTPGPGSVQSPSDN